MRFNESVIKVTILETESRIYLTAHPAQLTGDYVLRSGDTMQGQLVIAAGGLDVQQGDARFGDSVYLNGSTAGGLIFGASILTGWLYRDEVTGNLHIRPEANLVVDQGTTLLQGNLSIGGYITLPIGFNRTPTGGDVEFNGTSVRYYQNTLWYGELGISGQHFAINSRTTELRLGNLGSQKFIIHQNQVDSLLPYSLNGLRVLEDGGTSLNVGSGWSTISFWPGGSERARYKTTGIDFFANDAATKLYELGENYHWFRITSEAGGPHFRLKDTLDVSQFTVDMVTGNVVAEGDGTFKGSLSLTAAGKNHGILQDRVWLWTDDGTETGTIRGGVSVSSTGVLSLYTGAGLTIGLEIDAFGLVTLANIQTLANAGFSWLTYNGTTGAVALSAGGTNQDITLIPSGTGAVRVSGTSIDSNGRIGVRTAVDSGYDLVTDSRIKAGSLVLGEVSGGFDQIQAVSANGLKLVSKTTITGDLVLQGNLERANAAGYYWSKRGTASIDVPGTFAKVSTASSTIAVRAENFAVDTNNRARYTGATPQIFKVHYIISRAVENPNVHIAFRVAKNGVTLPESNIQAKHGSGADREVMSVQAFVDLEPNDYVELWATNIDNVGDVYVEYGYCTILE